VARGGTHEEETTRAERGIAQQVQAMSRDQFPLWESTTMRGGTFPPGSIVASSRTPEVVAATARGRIVMTFV
jgi:hypothetical protein